MKTRALVLGLLLFAASPAFAADIDGRWAGAIESPNGPINVGFTFKADGPALTGTMLGMDGMEIPIKDGKVDGSNITFAVSLEFGGMPLDLAYKGVVKGGELTLTIDFGGMPFEFVVKKAN